MFLESKLAWHFGNIIWKYDMLHYLSVYLWVYDVIDMFSKTDARGTCEKNSIGLWCWQYCQISEGIERHQNCWSRSWYWTDNKPKLNSLLLVKLFSFRLSAFVISLQMRPKNKKEKSRESNFFFHIKVKIENRCQSNRTIFSITLPPRCAQQRREFF